jgi:hypothetical protein
VLTFARSYWRHIVVLVVTGVALTMSVIAVKPVLFTADAQTTGPTGAQIAAVAQTRAKKLLNTVLKDERALYAVHHTFAGVTVASLQKRTGATKVVGAKTGAHSGQVSLKVDSARRLTLATPADAHRCVFVRDEPGAKTATHYAVTAATVCRAATAPAKGWSTR